MSFQYIKEPYEFIDIGVTSEKEANESLDHAYLYAIYSYHQLVRFNLYSKHKKISTYRDNPCLSNRDILVNDLYAILSKVYSQAERLYSTNSIATKYNCEEIFQGYKTTDFTKSFIIDKIFKILLQATLELYLTYISYLNKNYIASLGFKAIFDETNSMLTVHLKSVRAGKIGGSKKRDIYSPDKEKALAYHDKFFMKRKDNGKFIYSNDETAREIIAYFKAKNDSLNYTERSLSNIISKHRSAISKT